MNKYDVVILTVHCLLFLIGSKFILPHEHYRPNVRKVMLIVRF